MMNSDGSNHSEENFSPADQEGTQATISETQAGMPVSDTPSEEKSQVEEPNSQGTASAESQANPENSADHLEEGEDDHETENAAISDEEREKLRAQKIQEAEDEKNRLKTLSTDDILSEMQRLISAKNPGVHNSSFFLHQREMIRRMNEEEQEMKERHLQDGGEEESFSYHHKNQAQVGDLTAEFRKQYDEYIAKKSEDQEKNQAERRAIIDQLKHLYTSPEPGINYFREIRKIKDAWKNAGQVNKNAYKLLNEDYYFHLTQFNEMLNLNREYLEQEYAHNLQTRYQLIEAAKKLESEPLIQKALNDLQFLHKTWKEEAEPVAEEFREKTWDEFKEISNRIHDRKAELIAEQDKEREANFERREEIISAIAAIDTSKAASHAEWQHITEKITPLREEFFSITRIPKAKSEEQWQKFKSLIKEFTTQKNTFYKNQKADFQKNIDAKNKLIEKAKENQQPEDWDAAALLFKDLQREWKNSGSVPRSLSNKMWNEFRELCNTFFENFRKSKSGSGDNWQENFENKKVLLDELKNQSEITQETLTAYQNKWESLGKVPREHTSINDDFRKIIRAKADEAGISLPRPKSPGKNMNVTADDPVKRLKTQIAEVQQKITHTENNLQFFNNPSRENPLLADTFSKLDADNARLATLKEELKHIQIESRNASKAQETSQEDAES